MDAHTSRTAGGELWREDATGLAALLERGQITPIQLLDMYLERCERLAALNAFTFLDRSGAAAAAEAATGRQKAGRRLARISHTKKCIGAPNQRKFFCDKDFPQIRGRPDDDRLWDRAERSPRPSRSRWPAAAAANRVQSTAPYRLAFRILSCAAGTQRPDVPLVPASGRYRSRCPC